MARDATVARRVDLHIRRARAFGSLGQWAAEKDDALRALASIEPSDLERRAELVLMVADASFYLLDNAAVNRYAAEALDPALVLWTLNALLALDGDDALADEARTVSAAIRLELPDESMQRRFDDSELVQAIPHS